jgi:hypothetical protein
MVEGTAPLAPELVELLAPEPVDDDEFDVVVVLDVFSVL